MANTASVLAPGASYPIEPAHWAARKGKWILSPQIKKGVHLFMPASSRAVAVAILGALALLFETLGVAITFVFFDTGTLKLKEQLFTNAQGSEMLTIGAAWACGYYMAEGAFLVAFLMWVHRVVKNLPALGADRISYTPGWAVASFFIPIVCLYAPYQAIQEAWRASEPLAYLRSACSWKDARPSWTIRLWWIFCLLVPVRMAFNAHPGLLQDGPLALPLVALALLSHLATPFTIAMVLMLTKRQQVRYRLALAHEAAATSHHESAIGPVDIDQQEGDDEQLTPLRLALGHADVEETIPFAEEVQPPMALQWRSRVFGSSVSRTQVFVLVAGLAALTLSSIYLPWETEVTELFGGRAGAYTRHYTVSTGYDWIWNQSPGVETSGSTGHYSRVSVQWSNVYPLWVGIAASSAALFLLASCMGRRQAG